MTTPGVPGVGKPLACLIGKSYGDRMIPFDWMQGHSPRWHSHSVEVDWEQQSEKGGSRLTVEPIPSAVNGFPKTHKSSSLSGGTSDSSTSRWYVSLFFGAKLQYMSADDWLAQAVCPILLSPGPFPCLERFGRSLLADTGRRRFIKNGYMIHAYTLSRWEHRLHSWSS